MNEVRGSIEPLTRIKALDFRVDGSISSYGVTSGYSLLHMFGMNLGERRVKEPARSQAFRRAEAWKISVAFSL